MAWVTPKTDWATDDAVGTADLNRIEENISVLKGIVNLLFPFLGQLKGTATVNVSTYAMTFDNIDTVGGNYYELPGALLRFISVNGITPGTIITLRGSGLVLAHDYGAPPEFTYAAIYCPTKADITIGSSGSPSSAEFVSLVYDGTYWSVIGRY